MRRASLLAGHLVPSPVQAASPPFLPPPEADLAKSDRTHRCSAPVGERMRTDSKEWEMRCKLALAYRIAAEYGWDQLVFNHITAKVPGSDLVEGGPHFLINPFGLRFDEVTASSLLKVDLEGNVLDKGSDHGPLFKQGFVVHSAVHAARPDVKCVWHCHHADTVAVLMTKAGLLPLSQEVLPYHGYISYHPFEGTAVDLDERQRMAQSLGPLNRVMLLENHGPVTCGGSIEEAFVHMYLITLGCTWQQKAMAAVGGDLSKLRIPSGEFLSRLQERARNKQGDAVDKKNEGYNEGLSMWHAARRKMEDKYGASNIYS
eukprot:TRINITY_DN66317_c0_g1_i1.p1 TRINITY_DN66317_c0_g1~~TRINITY_DN66317_c0_g1_i1.p1  ORF type:complete len:316 (-),score=66.07 TRINITY_DN66317_c0_g1_i1:48-995(-)